MLRRIFPRGSIRRRESTYPGHKNPASYAGYDSPRHSPLGTFLSRETSQASGRTEGRMYRRSGTPDLKKCRFFKEPIILILLINDH